MSKKLGLVIDIETGGLDFNQSIILEVSAIIYDRDTFDEVDTFSKVISDDRAIAQIGYLEKLSSEYPNHKPTEEPYKGAKIVHDMHSNSGLINEIKEQHASGDYYAMHDCESDFVSWLAKHGLGKNHIQVPATGSSVHFDLGFLKHYMPSIVENLHYRQLNVSSLKVAVDQWAPTTAEIRNVVTHPQKTHRGLDDCRDTLGELQFYLNYIIKPMESIYVARGIYIAGGEEGKNDANV